MNKHLIAFFLAFSLEVKVKAMEPAFALEPQNCLSESGYCMIRALLKNAIQEDNYRISVRPDTVLMRHNPFDWSFVSGQAFIKTKRELVFKTPYGDLTLTPNTQALITKTNNVYGMRVIFGRIMINGVGHKKEIAVLEGYENSISQVNESLKTEIGIPRPIVMEHLIKDWEYHFSGDKTKFAKELERFKNIFESAKKELSRLNQEIVSRELASVEESKSRAEANANYRKNLKKQNQEMARKRLLGE